MMKNKHFPILIFIFTINIFSQMLASYDMTDDSTLQKVDFPIRAAVKEEFIFICDTIDSIIQQASAIFLDVKPIKNEIIKDVPKNTVFEAKIKRTARITNIFAGTMRSAAGLPGVKTYLDVKKNDSCNLQIAENMEICYGKVFFTSSDTILLSPGTVYKLDGVVYGKPKINKEKPVLENQYSFFDNKILIIIGGVLILFTIILSIMIIKRVY